MPVKVTTSNNVFEFIYPATEWKSMVLPKMKEKDFKINNEDFYVGVKYYKD
ncbi:MAG: hypothetical protein IPP72_05725 [Chitinophagaceae bacterium]|nr:hypothetical protein [Chitinophagaceae bacterium]